MSAASLLGGIRGAKVGSSGRISQIKELFKLLKNNLFLCPADEAVTYGLEAYNSFGSLDKEKYDMIELTYKVALISDRFNEEPVEALLAHLTKKFGQTSNRVAVLRGMMLEATGERKKATDVYNEVLERAPHHLDVRRRMVAMAKDLGDIATAVKQLNGLLELVPTDKNALMQLAELYIELGRLDMAKFAMEELLLMCPEHYVYNVQYAELLYTLGGASNYRLARQYYCQALELKWEGNTRAMLGLCMATRALPDVTSAEGILYEKVLATLTAIYPKKTADLLSVLKVSQ